MITSSSKVEIGHGPPKAINFNNIISIFILYSMPAVIQTYGKYKVTNMTYNDKRI